MSSEMEVDEDSVMSENPVAVGRVSRTVHPLVLLNISEHWTRVKAQEGSAQQVIGALFGKRDGRNAELINSFELPYTWVDGYIDIDGEYYYEKEDQFKQVFPDIDYIGWYTTGGEPNDSDRRVHLMLSEITPSPFFLKFDPTAMGSERLPARLYESVVEIIDDEPTVLFMELEYNLAADEAERIAVNCVAPISVTDSQSLVAVQLSAQYSAIKILHSKVVQVLNYLKLVQQGKLPRNQDVLRDTRALCCRLPVMRSPTFGTAYYKQCNDVGLMTYLGSITKGCNDMNQLINRLNVLFTRQE